MSGKLFEGRVINDQCCPSGCIPKTSAVSAVVHHYKCVALYEANGLEEDEFWASFLASSSRMSNKDRLSVMFLSQVEHGHPAVFFNTPVRSQTVFITPVSPHLYETRNSEKCYDLVSHCTIIVIIFIIIIWYDVLKLKNDGWFIEICAVSKVSKKEIGRVFKLILKNLETSVELITTGDFMVQLCTLLVEVVAVVIYHNNLLT